MTDQKSLHELAREMLNKANLEMLTETGKLKVETLEEGMAQRNKDGTWPETAGVFSHKETGKEFDYSNEKDDPWATKHGLTHKVHMIAGETRFAKVKKTVAHVAVDENPDGTPKMEKWKLKKHRKFVKEDEIQEAGGPNDPRKEKKAFRKMGMSDPKYAAYAKGQSEKGKNPYPPGKRHDEWNRGNLK